MSGINPYWEKPPKPADPSKQAPFGFRTTRTPFTPTATPTGTPTQPVATPKVVSPTDPGGPPVVDPGDRKKLGQGLLWDLLKDLFTRRKQKKDIITEAETLIDDAGNVIPDEKMKTEDFFGNPDISIEIQQQVADALGVSIEDAMDLYAGYDIVTGHFDPVTGEFILGDVYTMVKRLKELADLSSSVPTLDEWQVTQGYDLKGINDSMGDLAALMEGGPSAADIASARQWQAENMGFGATDDETAFEQYQAYLQAQMGRSTEPMSEQEQADWARATEIGVRELREDKMGMIEAMGMSSSGRMYREMDQLSLGMADQRVAREMQRLEYEAAQQQVAFQQYLAMADMGTGQQAQFHELAFQNRMGALQAYAQQATMIMEQYGTELEGMQIHANMMYQSIMADMGYEQFVTDQILANYELEIMPILTELDLLMTEYELIDSQPSGLDYLKIALQFLPLLLL